MKNTNRISSRRAALIAGISLLLMAVIAGITYGYLHGNLIAADDAQATIQNLKTSQGLFYTEIFGWSVIFFLDGMVAWALYRFFIKTDPLLSFLSSLFRVIYTILLGFAIYNLPKILTTLNQKLVGFGVSERSQEILDHVQAFENLWSKSLIIFGLHLLTLGYLAFKSKYVPKVWGILLMVAGISYSYIHGMHAFFPHMSEQLITVESILSIPMFVGEVGFAVWLVAKGGKLKSQIPAIHQEKELQTLI